MAEERLEKIFARAESGRGSSRVSIDDPSSQSAPHQELTHDLRHLPRPPRNPPCMRPQRPYPREPASACPSRTGTARIARVLSTSMALTVSSSLDTSGVVTPGTLRYAIDYANEFGTSGEYIFLEFANGLGNIAMTQGPLVVNSAATVVFEGGSISGPNGGALHIMAGSDVELEDSTVRQQHAANANGGAINNAGTLFAVDATFSGNEATGSNSSRGRRLQHGHAHPGRLPASPTTRPPTAAPSPTRRAARRR